MPTKVHNKERRLIQFSIAMGTIYTLVGVAWGLVIQSGIILFDAIYSGVSILLSMMTMYALAIISKDDSFDAKNIRNSRFHMGSMAVEPLVNMVKSLVIISICLYGFVSAILVLQNGGAESANAVSGVYYGLITALICTCSWCFLKFVGRNQNDLIQAECEQWMVDAIFSVLVVFSFMASYWMSQIETLRVFARYADPVSVIVATLYFIKVPINRLLTSIKELLVMAPDETLQKDIEHALQPFVSQYGFTDHIARATKTGRQLSVDVTFIVGDSKCDLDIQQQDQIRQEIERCLNPLSDNLWLGVCFTHDRYWA
ncbi:cation transporter (plasmid) [Vibrio pelagius]|uniref:Cation transporter n=1 Tax=Vibrio pelagius TaxID=28169 RepID=A0ABY5GAU5_VIBPE|nr:cation transporter [Vibrio pelagius]UTT87302.1 cation transporter [Vibrio pelagius]